MKKTLQIISSTHAREVNSLVKPTRPHEWAASPEWLPYQKKLTDWQDAESSLKEYRIEAVVITDTISGFPTFTRSKKTRYPSKICGDYLSKKIGQKVDCECNEETLTCIVL